MIKRTLRFGAAALLAIVAFAACGSDAGDGGLDVVVSTTILGDIVENIVGDSATDVNDINAVAVTGFKQDPVP